jgi:hypothetical protein
MMILQRGGEPPLLSIEFVNEVDPAGAEQRRAQMERARRNSEWLGAHMVELLPEARGKFVAVAGEEGFIADTAEEAWAWARRAHPEDDGATVQYFRTDKNPRIYAHRG